MIDEYMNNIHPQVILHLYYDLRVQEVLPRKLFKKYQDL